MKGLIEIYIIGGFGNNLQMNTFEFCLKDYFLRKGKNIIFSLVFLPKIINISFKKKTDFKIRFRYNSFTNYS